MWWKIALVLIAVPIALILIMAVLGLFISKTHTATRRVQYNQPADVVWTAIADFASYPSWRKEITETKRLDDRDGQPVWQEVRARGDVMNMQVVAFDPPRRMVTKVVDNSMFGGTWTWEVEPTGQRLSTITITEDGEIYNPIFRFVARVFMGYRATMDGVHRALAEKFGETIELAG